MTFTYDVEELDTPETTEGRMTEVRFLVGDTDEDTAMVQDEEITLVLAQYPPVSGKPAWLAAAHVCDAIAGKFARKMQQSIGPLSAANQMQYEHYLQLAGQFRALHASNGQATTGMGSVKVASPILSGGGPTYLGPNQYQNARDGVNP